MGKKRIKVGKYKTVYRGEIFEIRQARATYPSGRTKLFEQAWRLPSVIILAVDEKGRLLLTSEYRFKFKKYIWNLPSGRVDRGESPLKAAQRELQEEAGVRAKKLRLFATVGEGTTLAWKKYIYVATGLKPSRLAGDEDEDIKVVPTSLAKANQMAVSGRVKHELMAYMIIRLFRERGKLGLK